jgi:hypothetical protein
MLGFNVAPIHGAQAQAVSQSWRTLLLNHVDAIASIDMCVVPTVTFERLFTFLFWVIAVGSCCGSR